jgi:hypothetical protein
VTLSIIIPAHNEGETLEANVEGFLSSLPAAARSTVIEIIIVENGSKDATLAVSQKLADRHRGLVRCLSLARGSYGEAIKAGMMAAIGSHLTILECDFLDVNFVCSSITTVQQNAAPFIVASKRHSQSTDRRPLKRRIFTLLFNLILNVTTGYPGKDTHGLKCIESGLAKRLCQSSITTDEVFQTEIVLLAWRWGVPIKEVPVVIEEIRASPVSVRRRLPMVLRLVSDLRRSLARFPRLDLKLSKLNSGNVIAR